MNSNKSVFSTNKKRLMLLLLGVTILFFLLESFNIAKTIYDARAALTFMYGFIHFFIELIRAMFCLIIIIRLLLFTYRLHNDEEGYLNELKKIKLPLIIKISIDFILLFFVFINENLIFINIFSLTYFIVLYNSLIKTISYYDNQSSKLINPVFPIVFITGHLMFIIFHYFFIQFGGNYFVFSHRMDYYVNIPFIKIILLALLDLAYLYIIKLIYNFDSIKLLNTILTGIIVVFILSITYIEINTSHYLYNVREFGLYNEENTEEPYNIEINNGKTRINPIPFIISNYSINQRSTIFDYLEIYSFNEIPLIESKLINKVSYDNQMIIFEVEVYNENLEKLTEIYDWYQLDQLDEGKYYVLVVIGFTGDPAFEYADYLFVLDLNE